MTDQHKTTAGIANDNRHAPIPYPRGGFSTNAAEAEWLAATLTMRLQEALASVGIRAQPVPTGLRDLLLLSLDAASKRGVRHGR